MAWVGSEPVNFGGLQPSGKNLDVDGSLDIGDNLSGVASRIPPLRGQIFDYCEQIPRDRRLEGGVIGEAFQLDI